MNPGKVQRAIIEVLADVDERGLTPRELQQKTCEHLDTPHHEVFPFAGDPHIVGRHAALFITLEPMVDVYKWVELVPEDMRRIRITEAGRELIRATS